MLSIGPIVRTQKSLSHAIQTIKLNKEETEPKQNPTESDRCIGKSDSSKMSDNGRVESERGRAELDNGRVKSDRKMHSGIRQYHMQSGIRHT